MMVNVCISDLLGETVFDGSVRCFYIRAISHGTGWLGTLWGDIVGLAVGGCSILHPELEVVELGSRDI
jgi:hypothetical protein